MDYTNKNIDDETKSKLSFIEDAFISMRASGQTVRQIARKLKKSDHTICDLNKKYFRQVEELQKEKLEVLQKKMFEQKQGRLDFFTEQLDIIKETIKTKQIFLPYGELVALAIKISSALNKCEQDMLLNDLLPDKPLEPDTPGNGNSPATNVAGCEPDNLQENNEVITDSANPGNAATKNKKSNSSANQIKKEEKKNADNAPPASRADYYKRVLKDKIKSQKPSD